MDAPARVHLNVSRYWPKGLTVRQAAEDLKMNTRSISAIRKGTEKGDWATLVKLSRYFNVSINQLLDIEEDQK